MNLQKRIDCGTLSDMDGVGINEKLKKYFIASGALCFPLGGICIGCIVLLFIEFVRLFYLPNLDSRSILYFIGWASRVGLGFVSVVGIIVFTVLAVKFALCGVELLRQKYVRRVRSAINFSFAASLSLLLVCIYPFIINTLRIIVHGYQAQYYLGFWLGLVTFVFSVACLVVNRITVKKHKSALQTLYATDSVCSHNEKV